MSCCFRIFQSLSFCGSVGKIPGCCAPCWLCSMSHSILVNCRFSFVILFGRFHHGCTVTTTVNGDCERAEVKLISAWGNIGGAYHIIIFRARKTMDACKVKRPAHLLSVDELKWEGYIWLVSWSSQFFLLVQSPFVWWNNVIILILGAMVRWSQEKPQMRRWLPHHWLSNFGSRVSSPLPWAFQGSGLAVPFRFFIFRLGEWC